MKFTYIVKETEDGNGIIKLILIIFSVPYYLSSKLYIPTTIIINIIVVIILTIGAVSQENPVAIMTMPATTRTTSTTTSSSSSFSKSFST